MRADEIIKQESLNRNKKEGDPKIKPQDSCFLFLEIHRLKITYFVNPLAKSYPSTKLELQQIPQIQKEPYKLWLTIHACGICL